MAFIHKITGIVDHPHDTAAEARECLDAIAAEDAWMEQEAEEERRAELAVERYYEDRGYEEARWQEQEEARRGVLSFTDAWDLASPGTRPGYTD